MGMFEKIIERQDQTDSLIRNLASRQDRTEAVLVTMDREIKDEFSQIKSTINDMSTDIEEIKEGQLATNAQLGEQMLKLAENTAALGKNNKRLDSISEELQGNNRRYAATNAGLDQTIKNLERNNSCLDQFSRELAENSEMLELSNERLRIVEQNTLDD